MGRPIKTLRGNCMMYSRNKSLIVSDRTKNWEGLGDFSKHLGEAAGSAAKNVGKKILNIQGRALELAANIGTAAATKNPKLIAASAPDVIKFVHQGKGLYKAEGLSGKGLSGKGLSGKGLSGKSLSGKWLYLGKIH